MKKLFNIKHRIAVDTINHDYKFALYIGKHVFLFGKPFIYTYGNVFGFNDKKMYRIYIWRKVMSFKKHKSVHKFIYINKHYVSPLFTLLPSDFDGDILSCKI